MYGDVRCGALLDRDRIACGVLVLGSMLGRGEGGSRFLNPFRTGTETANAGSRASDPSAARMGVQVIGKSNRCTHVSYVIAATSHSRALGHLVLCSSKVELHMSLPPQEMPGAAGSRKGSKLRTPGRSHAPEPVFAITPTASKPSSDTRAMTLVSVEHHAASRQRGGCHALTLEVVWIAWASRPCARKL